MTTYSIHVNKGQLSDDKAILFDFYLPISTKVSLWLYLFLQVSAGQLDEAEIARGCQLNIAQMKKALGQLEGLGLVTHYVDDTLVVQPVLSPHAFFSHLSLSRLLMDRIGQKAYDTLMAKYLYQTQSENISQSLDVSRLNQWSTTQEKQMVQRIPQPHYQFDMKRFLMDESVFPRSLRTQENLEFIARLADTHGISAKQMKPLMLDVVDPFRCTFDKEKLVQMIIDRQTKPEPDSVLAFFQSYQPNVPISRADRRLIQDLTDNYGLDSQTCKALIAHVLETNDMNFSRSLVEKVAASWSRRQQKSQKESSWYDHRDQRKSTQEDIDELKSMIAQLEQGESV